MYEGIDKKYVEEIRELKEGKKSLRMRKPFHVKSIIKRAIGSVTKGQLFILAVLLGLLGFFFKNESVPTILAVLGVMGVFSLFILIFRRAIEAPVDENDPFEPGSDDYFTYGPGSQFWKDRH